jgi:hypothetical protein
MFQKTQEDQLVILYRDYLFHLELNYLKRLQHAFVSKLNLLNSCLKEKSKLTCEVRKTSIFLKIYFFMNQNFLDSSRNTI